MAELATVEAVKVLVIGVMLAYTSWLDFRTREVEPKIWLLFGIPVLLLTVYELLFLNELIYIIIMILGIVIVVGVVGAFYYIGLIGGGDLFALLVITLAHPWNPLYTILTNTVNTQLPFVMSVIVYASIGTFLLTPIYLVNNLLKEKEELARVPRKYRILYAVTAAPVKISVLLKKRFWYPLERPWSEKRYKTYFDVEEEDEDIRKTIIRELEKGSLSSEQKLWSTYGLPFIIFITIGYVISMVGGDQLLIKLLMLILG